eukprot:987395-Pleurochrysis_carterae.AAC.5
MREGGTKGCMHGWEPRAYAMVLMHMLTGAAWTLLDAGPLGEASSGPAAVAGACGPALLEGVCVGRA